MQWHPLMKTNLLTQSTKAIGLTLLLSILHSAFSTARAQGTGTSFTYQGRLNTNGIDATGAFDVRFTIFGDPVLPGSVGLPVTNSAVAVSNGLFTTIVDFNLGPWDNQPRWMELAFKAAGST